LPVLSEPLVAFVPDHPPDAVQDVAFVLVHDSVLLVFGFTQAGLALNVTVGGPDATVTLADWVTEPPAPVQASVNVAFAVRLLLVSLPEVAFVPVQPPLAVQDVALVDDQLSVVLPL
jgi:hypothetical protein